MDPSNPLKKLWSSKPARQQQTTPSGKTPSFNLSSFGSPSLLSARNESQSTSSPSSFYSGKVQFGGAMNTSRNHSNLSTPYMIPKINKVRARGNTSAGTKADSSIAGSIGNTLSSTARKILQTLEKMSTPLRDMKKIPPPNRRTPTTFMSRHQQRRTLGSSLLDVRKMSGPPTKGLTSISHATVNASANIPLDNSLTSTQSIIKNVASSVNCSPITSTSPVTHRGAPDVVASMSSSSGVKLKSSRDAGGGGKMKHQRRNMSHYSSAYAQGSPEGSPTDLPPDVSMPIASLPTFNFSNRPGSTSTPAVQKISKHKTKNIPHKTNIPSEPIYTFSSPSPMSPGRIQTSHNTSVKLQFTSPSEYKVRTSNKNVAQKLKVKEVVKSPLTRQSKSSFKSKLTKSDSVLKAGGSVMDILGKASNDSDKKESKGNAPAASKPSLGDMFQKPKNKWECEVCMLMNDEEVMKCDACESLKPGSKQQQPLKATSDVGKWSCKVCLIKNDDSRQNCEACKSPKPGSASSKETACEAPKPGSAVSNTNKAASKPFSSNVASFGAKSDKFSFGLPKSSTVKFGAPKKSETGEMKPLIAAKNNNTWECDVCLINNDNEKLQCAACENPKPGSKPKKEKNETLSTGIMFGLKPKDESKWVCNICLISNERDRTKCAACENPKPGSNNDASSGFKGSTFKFGNTSSTVFKFGVSEKTAATTAPSVNTTVSKPVIATQTTSATPQVGFKFGVATSSSTKEVSKPSSSEDVKPNLQTTTTSVAPFAIETPKPSSSTGNPPDKPILSQFPLGGAKPLVPSEKPAEKKVVAPFVFGGPKQTTSNEKAQATSSLFTFGSKSSPSHTDKPPNAASNLFPTSARQQLSAKSPANKRQIDDNDIQTATKKPIQMPTAMTKPPQTTTPPVNQPVQPTNQPGQLVNQPVQPVNQPGQLVNRPVQPVNQPGQLVNRPVLPFGSLAPVASTNATAVFPFKPQVTQTPNTQAKFGFGNAPAFGAKAIETPPKQTAPSIFGGPATASKAVVEQKAAFSGFGQQPTTLNPPKQSGFSFGQSTAGVFSAGNSSLPKTGFSFGITAAASNPPTTNIFGNSNQTSTPQAGFGFNASKNSSTPAQSSSLFSNSQTVPKPTFNFGGSEPPKPSAGFQFGAAGNKPPTATPAGGFSFGSASQNKNTFSANTAPAQGGFNFGSQPQSFQFAGSNAQPKPDSTSGFQFNAQPPTFGSPAQNNMAGGSMFSIGQSGSNQSGRSTTPNQSRTIKRATRRLKK